MTSLPPQSLIAAVERAVGQLPSQWEKLLGGRSNALWRGRTGGADLVVKLYLPSGATPLFPNDPAAEHQILQDLGPLGLAPEALAHIHGEFGTALIYRYVDGQAGDVTLTDLAKVLRRVHQLRPENPPGLMPSGSEALLRQASEILSWCQDDPHGVAARIEALRHAAPIDGVETPALIHRDPVWTNVVRSSSGVVLIDWQCPAMSDPCEDIAIVLSPFMQVTYLGRRLVMQEVQEFLKSYSCAETVARYRTLAPFFAARMAAYAQWCAEAGRGAAKSAVQDELRFSEVSEISEL